MKKTTKKQTNKKEVPDSWGKFQTWKRDQTKTNKSFSENCDNSRSNLKIKKLIHSETLGENMMPWN